MENKGIICNSSNIHYMDNLYKLNIKEKAPLIECFVIYFFNTSDFDSKTP